MPAVASAICLAQQVWQRHNWQDPASIDALWDAEWSEVTSIQAVLCSNHARQNAIFAYFGLSANACAAVGSHKPTRSSLDASHDAAIVAGDTDAKTEVLLQVSCNEQGGDAHEPCFQTLGRDLEVASPPTLDTSTCVLPSVGSAGHDEGSCKRCAFFVKGRCNNGAACSHCHFDHERRPRQRARRDRTEAKRLLLVTVDDGADVGSQDAGQARLTDNQSFSTVDVGFAVSATDPLETCDMIAFEEKEQWQTIEQCKTKKAACARDGKDGGAEDSCESTRHSGAPSEPSAASSRSASPSSSPDASSDRRDSILSSAADFSGVPALRDEIVIKNTFVEVKKERPAWASCAMRRVSSAPAAWRRDHA